MGKEYGITRASIWPCLMIAGFELGIGLSPFGGFGVDNNQGLITRGITNPTNPRDHPSKIPLDGYSYSKMKVLVKKTEPINFFYYFGRFK